MFSASSKRKEDAAKVASRGRTPHRLYRFPHRISPAHLSLHREKEVRDRSPGLQREILDEPVFLRNFSPAIKKISAIGPL